MQWDEGERHTNVWLEILEGKSYLQEVCVDGRIIRNCILNKYFGRMRTEIVWIGIRTNSGLYGMG
jgi:hypothetical protein